jgi:hypothetical protein
MDHLVGQLLEEIETAGLTQTTMVVFHSDVSVDTKTHSLPFCFSRRVTTVPG